MFELLPWVAGSRFACPAMTNYLDAPERPALGRTGSWGRREWGQGVPRRNSSEQPHVPDT
jgi:hypothetical protein